MNPPPPRARAVADPAFDPALETVVSLDPARPLPAVDGGDGLTAAITATPPTSSTCPVAAPHPGLLVLAEAHYPGWKAWVDGAPPGSCASTTPFAASPCPPAPAACASPTTRLRAKRRARDRPHRRDPAGPRPRRRRRPPPPGAAA
ncbi:MAG: hypothetical protein U1G05_02535 [Kiritimatiellia bacterium]